MALSWRKIKHDLKSELTEASAIGALCSIAAGLFILYLLFSQIGEYRTLQSETQVMLDHYSHMNGGGMDDEDTLQINFNLSFPHLSCEYASVDATNFMGTHDAGIAARVSKIHLDNRGRQLGPHKDRKEQKHAMDETPHTGKVTSVDLNKDNFDALSQKHDIMIVNFFTPWCHWCQKLEPVWEKSAAKVSDLHPGDERLILAKIDCTSDKSESLCTKYKIDAFPTIMVFRKETGTDKAKDRERYHGERTVDAITAWAGELFKQIKSEVPKSRVIDVDKDGEKDSHNGVGCMVAGMLHVQKAPGGIVVQAVSDGHEFNWATMDVSHTVNHLSFGPFLSETAWVVMPPDIAQAVGSLDDKKFTAEDRVPTTHEHMVKVVKNLVEMPSSWSIAPIEAHGYVVHSNKIQRFAEVPTVRINYDILPIIVHVKATYESTYHFLTQLCAIVGGVFTVVGIVVSTLEGGIASLTQKDSLGKLG
jgi:thiol-disulfide isomerase/thioredoxin